MAIIGLTDVQSSFPRIGELRKGDVKGDKRPGRDLTHFRFTSSLPGTVEKFTAIYGDEPNEIDCFFPYATTDENFEAWQEEWAAGGLVHRCDGQQVVMYQKDGKYVMPDYGTLPCPYATGKRERTRQQPGCKQAGRLKVILPALGRLAYVVALTTSINDIMELHANLSAYEALRGDLRGIPFILSRVPRMISTPTDDGKRARREKWLLHIEAAPEWVQAQLSVMQRAALPGASTPRLMIASNSQPDIVEVVDCETGEIIELPDSPEPGTWEHLVEGGKQFQSGNGKQFADIRADLEGQGDTLKAGFVCDRLVMTKLYKNTHHALGAINKSPSIPDGKRVSFTTSLKLETALSVFDWCIDRKEGDEEE